MTRVSARRAWMAFALLAVAGVAQASPVLVTPDNGALNPQVLSWSDTGDPDGPFDLYLGMSPTGMAPIALDLSVDSYVLSSLTPATYYWRVINSAEQASVVRSFVVHFNTSAPVPEPQSLLLALTALAGLALARRPAADTGPC